MNIFLLAIFSLSIVVFLFAFIGKQKKKIADPAPVAPAYRIILSERVPFYQQLPPDKKLEFENRVQQFLMRVKITPVKAPVEDIDKVFIAASAIIPIFNFPGWEYINLHEVLLYPGSFDHDFEQQGPYRPITGMVGSGAFNHVMLLSQYALREGFSNKAGKTNTAIHEFVHLVDKMDGVADGVPAFVLQQQFIIPWLQMIHREIKKILENRSDINPYGATNEAEFFAVVAEYFFARPDLLKEKHPDLYELLLRIFNPVKSH